MILLLLATFAAICDHSLANWSSVGPPWPMICAAVSPERDGGASYARPSPSARSCGRR